MLIKICLTSISLQIGTISAMRRNFAGDILMKGWGRTESKTAVKLTKKAAT